MIHNIVEFFSTNVSLSNIVSPLIVAAIIGVFGFLVHLFINSVKNNSERKLEKIKKVLDRGDRERAKHMYLDIIPKLQDDKKDFMLSRAFSGVGKIWVTEGDIEEAINRAEQAIETSKGANGDAYIVRGMAFSFRNKEGDHDKAIADFTTAMKRTLTNLTEKDEPYRLRGTEYGQIGDFVHAIEDLNIAISINPNNAFTFNNRGLAYCEKGNYEHAISDFTKALSINPSFVPAYSNRGRVYYNMKKYESAINDYNKALSINPNLADVYSNRGVTYNVKGDYNRAIADFDKAISLNPNCVRAYYNRGLMYYDRGDYAQARSNWEQALKIAPNLTAVQNELNNLTQIGY
jgi:tetratricopeptide (TPR) repeat protein